MCVKCAGCSYACVSLSVAEQIASGSLDIIMCSNLTWDMTRYMACHFTMRSFFFGKVTALGVLCCFALLFV